MEEKLEYTKMQERIDWAFNTLRKKLEDEKLSVSDDIFLTQVCEIAKTLFVRSEIAYSSKNR